MLDVGQKIWLVYFDIGRGSPKELVVESVDDKWSFVQNNWKVNNKTMQCCAEGKYIGICQTNIKEYEEKKARDKAWSILVIRINNEKFAPRDVSIEDIRRASRLLGLDEIGIMKISLSKEEKS